MPRVDFDGVVGLEKVLREKKSFGEYGTTPLSDYDVIQLKKEIIEYYASFVDKNEPSNERLLVSDEIWCDAQKLHEHLGFGVLKEDSGQYQDEEQDSPKKKPRERIPLQWDRKKPTYFDIKGWGELGIDEGRIVDEDMSRHFLILGETGSGKTASGVMPLLKSILRYDGSGPKNSAAALVIDPKSELKDFVEIELVIKLCKEKLISLKLDGTNNRLHVFESIDFHAVKDDHAVIVDKILKAAFDVIGPKPELSYEDFKKWVTDQCSKKLISLNLDKKEYRLHVFEGKDLQKLTAYEILKIVLPLSESFLGSSKGTKDPYWHQHPRSIIESVLGVLLHSEHKYGSDGEKKDFWKAFAIASNQKALPLYYNPANYFLPMKSFFTLAISQKEKCWTAFKTTCDNFKIPPTLSSIADDMLGMGMRGDHYPSLIAIVNLFVSELCLPDLVKHVSLNPHEKPHNHISIEDAVEEGKVLVYSPNTNSFVANAIGRLIKAQFFAATWTRENKERPVAYVCDEFQRFITGDPESGEQSFLDRCRSYRAVCVLATQSIASINKALHDTDERAVQDTVSIILNNTGTKLFFRNTDVDTQDRLKKLIPSNTLGNLHIVDVRPVSTLKVGECYYLLVDGRWGRGQARLRSGSETQPNETNNSEFKKQPDDSLFANPSTCQLLGEVKDESILSLCKNIDQAVYYFKYRHITIEICSPGGEISALEHFLNRLKGWRERNVIFETVATIDTASAAAMIHSLGDIGHRRAYSSASLHYHYGRNIISSNAVLTKAVLDQMSNSLSKIDDKFISTLVSHVWKNADARKLIDLKKLYKTLQKNESRLSLPAIGYEYEPKAQADKGKIDLIPRKPTREKYETVLRELFANDMPIRPEEAKLLGLIDEVIGEEEEIIRKASNKDNPVNRPS